MDKKKIFVYNLEKDFDDDEKEILKRLKYPLPNEILDATPDELERVYEVISNDTKVAGNRVGALKRTKNKTEDEEIELDLTKKHHEAKKI